MVSLRGENLVKTDTATPAPIPPETQQKRFIDLLRRLNAKERNFLMRYALLPDDKLSLSPRFMGDLLTRLKVIGLDEVNATTHCIYFGMDYHLAWIGAALAYATGKLRFDTDDSYECPNSNTWLPLPELPKVAEGKKKQGHGRVEDVDLLLLLAPSGEQEPLVLVLIEAKGDAPFNNKQFNSKLRRLQQLRELIEGHCNWLKTIMLFMSPNRPSKPTLKRFCNELRTVNFWPNNDKAQASLMWMKLDGFDADLKDCGPAQRISICADDGKWGVKKEKLIDKPYTHWRIEPRPDNRKHN